MLTYAYTAITAVQTPAVGPGLRVFVSQNEITEVNATISKGIISAS
jgi:hypothetical protein